MPDCSLLSGECYLGMFRSLYAPTMHEIQRGGTEIVTPGEFYITAFLHKHSHLFVDNIREQQLKILAFEKLLTANIKLGCSQLPWDWIVSLEHIACSQCLPHILHTNFLFLNTLLWERRKITILSGHPEFFVIRHHGDSLKLCKHLQHLGIIRLMARNISLEQHIRFVWKR